MKWCSRFFSLFRYLGRFDEELEQIQVKHTVGQRKSRQHASREDVIKMTKAREMNEFNTCGLGTIIVHGSEVE